MSSISVKIHFGSLIKLEKNQSATHTYTLYLDSESDHICKRQFLVENNSDYEKQAAKNYLIGLNSWKIDSLWLKKNR